MNAVYLEMVKLGKKWNQEQKKNPEAVSYVLLGERPQNQLFETWFKYQLSEDSKTNDTYLIYYQAFENTHTYSASLLEELKYVYEQWQKETDGAPGWQTADGTKDKGPSYYIDALLGFLEQYPQLKENKIFIHLAPTAITDRNAYEAWINECGKHIETRNAVGLIKLVFTDHGSHRTVKNFYKPHFWEFPIDLSKLMEKTAEGTNRQKGARENNFQQLILKAGNFLGKQQFQEAEFMLNQAMKLAVANKYNQGAVMAGMLKAQNYQAQSKYDDAAAVYEQAVKDAKGDADTLVQVYFSYGAFLLSRKEKKKAMEIFEAICLIGERKGDLVLQIESNRLIGQLSDAGISSQNATSCYEKCIAFGQQLPRNELPQTSLPYIASLLMKKYGGGTEKAEVLNSTMTDLFGAEWMQLVVIPELKNYKNSPE